MSYPIQGAIKVLAIWYIFSSITLFIIYGLDKTQAKIYGRRIPEKIFHSLALSGGFVGGFLGRIYFHHKTRKPLFLWILWISAFLHSLAWFIWLTQ